MRSLEPGETFASDFRVERRLGQGGMGAVYVATQLSTGKRRALKVMLPELVEDPAQRARFDQEARIGARIASDHVVDVIAAGVDAATGAPWLGMELLEGEDLADRVARRGAPPLAEVLAIAAQLAHALNAAHAAGVVHRDLKPENVFVASVKREGASPIFVKVIDFGIAKLISGSSPAQTAPIGTLAWMAPEQTDPRGAIGPATDVWAFGLLVFFLVTGRSYWPLDAAPSVLIRKLVLDPIMPASARAAELGAGPLAPGFDAWFERCAARDPGARFAGAAAAVAELERVLALSPPKSALAATEAAPSVPARRRLAVPVLDSPRRGPIDALVTIVEFADFECPFSVGAEDVVRELLAEHPADVALVWKDVPYDVHSSAASAARLARLARAAKGEDAFWIAHDRLFASCPTRGLAEVSAIGAELGLDEDALAAAVAGPDDAGTTRDVELALDLRASLIPHFFVNGRRLIGIRALGELRAVVEEELAAARARIANGEGRAEAIRAATRDAVVAPPPETLRTVSHDKLRSGKIVGARAAVDVHQFVDRNSPFASIMEPVIRRLLAARGDVIRYHFHELVDFGDPISVDAGAAALASLDIGGDAGYWRMHELLLANGPRHPAPLTPGRGLARAALFQYARESGLHDGYFRVSFDNPERRRELERAHNAAVEVGVKPGEFVVVVGGRRCSGLLYRELERAVDVSLRETGAVGALDRPASSGDGTKGRATPPR